MSAPRLVPRDDLPVDESTADALRAVAYEQRTANLLTLMRLTRDYEERDHLRREVRRRLDLPQPQSGDAPSPVPFEARLNAVTADT